MYNHFYNVKKRKIPNGNFRLYEKIKSIINDGKSIVYEINFSSNNEKEAYDYEFQLIKKIGIENLCNLFFGYGGSYSGKKHWNFGKTTPQNVKDKIGRSKLGDKHSEKTKMKMRESKQGKPHPMYGKHHTENARRKMSENHANFNGKSNPFYGKSHNEKTKDIFRKLYSITWGIILPNDTHIIVTGKRGVKKYVDDYNIINHTKVSCYSLFQYGKNGDGWKLEKFVEKKEN